MLVDVEQGKVHFPVDAPWLNDLMIELGAFPAGLNDDQVDALSQAVEFFRRLLKSRFHPKYKKAGGFLRGSNICAWPVFQPVDPLSGAMDTAEFLSNFGVYGGGLL